MWIKRNSVLVSHILLLAFSILIATCSLFLVPKRNIHLLLKSLYPYVTGSWPGFKSIFCAAAAVGELFKVEFPAILQCFQYVWDQIGSCPAVLGTDKKSLQTAISCRLQHETMAKSPQWCEAVILSIVSYVGLLGQIRASMYFFILFFFFS